ncbi:hypothetical protein [Allosphingosinicella sp.]|jgi:uncharacterized protein YlxW (UPF0749 family)|uniref:hypothetical protein n=1 Tax=Allosphingosinicella sp. TaxID=2823234 RepID=UPI002F08119D
MQSNHIMVIVIVTVVMLATIIKTAIAARRPRGDGGSPETRAEANRLRDEVKQLKERLAVLERITIEKENSLEREIESLRDAR